MQIRYRFILDGVLVYQDYEEDFDQVCGSGL